MRKHICKALRKRSTQWDAKEALASIVFLLVFTSPALLMVTLLDITTDYKHGSLGNATASMAVQAIWCCVLLKVIAGTKSKN